MTRNPTAYHRSDWSLSKSYKRMIVSCMHIPHLLNPIEDKNYTARSEAKIQQKVFDTYNTAFISRQEELRKLKAQNSERAL